MKASQLSVGQVFQYRGSVFRVVSVGRYYGGRFHAMQADPLSGAAFERVLRRKSLGLSGHVSISKNCNVSILPETKPK